MAEIIDMQSTKALVPYVEPLAKQCEGIPEHLTGPVRWDHPCSAHIQVLDARRGICAPADGRKRSSVCIVGYAENSRHLAWYDDPDCEIWGVNQISRFIPREDRHFQIHKDWNDATHWAPNTDQHAWMQHAPIPTYMIEPVADIQNSVAYPVDWVKEQLGLAGDKDIPGSGIDYFTSTIAFMYALAIAEGFTRIGIYGIDLVIGREYFFEKACVEFYMGLAHGRGIHIDKPANSALLWQSHRYGWELAPDYGLFGLPVLDKRLHDLKREVQRTRDLVYIADGKFQEAQHVLGNLPEQMKPEYEKHAEVLRLDLDKKLNTLYGLDGAMQEIDRMHKILELKSRGGEVRLVSL